MCVCVLFGQTKQKPCFFDLRDKLSLKKREEEKRKKKKKTACRLFPHTRESVRERSQVRETIIISSAAAAWRKVVAVVVVEMA